VKLIPVRVLDSNGRPVKGLTKEDFVLYDNKKLQIITEFEVHEAGKTRSPVAEPGAAVPPKAQPYTNRKYFILLDIQGSDEIGMANAKEAALEFINTKIYPGDEVSILSFAPMTGLIMQQYLTSDLKKIKKGIKRAKEIPPTPDFSSRPTSDAEERAVIANREGTEEMVSTDPPFGGAREFIGVQGLRVHSRRSANFTASMSELAKIIKFIPGSKNLMYFSTREPGKKVARLFAEANAPVFAINTKNWIS
jgi:VWFA-related protein